MRSWKTICWTILWIGLLIEIGSGISMRLDSEIQVIPPSFHEKLELWIESHTQQLLELELQAEIELREGRCSLEGSKLSCHLDPGLNSIWMLIRSKLLDLGGGRYILKRSYPLRYDSLSLMVLMPAEYQLNPDFSYPGDYLEFPYAGMNAYLWRSSNGSDFFLIALFESRNPPGIPWLIPVLLGSIAACIGLGMYRFRWARAKLQISPGLLESEQKVIQCLINAKDQQLMQYQLQKLTGFSKPKLSRVLRSLEQRGLIEKHPRGSTNLIKLKPLEKQN